MNIPIELFAVFLGVSLTFLAIGISKRVGVSIFIAGVFILTISAMTDNIIMGKIPVESTTSGATTTYVFEDNLFQFSELHKVVLALIGIFIMLIGVMYKD